jgi:hypothetical protein
VTRNALRDQAMLSQHNPEVVLGPERPGNNSRFILVIALLLVVIVLGILQLTGGGGGASPSPTPSLSPSPSIVALWLP